jgi:MoxR-like ATPase
MFDLKNIRTTSDSDPRHYVINDEGLRKAVDMSIWLQKPLLITGAPGTGKTQLAFKVAFELSQLTGDKLKGFAPFAPTPLIFNTKTTATSTDLFYTYDAIGHFQQRVAAQGNAAQALSAHHYINLNALGMAIAQSWGSKAIEQHESLAPLAMLANYHKLQPLPMSTVVLIDEIDKAPRDFPNDLLHEIEHLAFGITEINQRVTMQHAERPLPRLVILMTSNFEKNLPDAFLRRCLFYHIPSPNSEQIFEIVCSRMAPYMEQAWLGGRYPAGQSFEECFALLKPRLRKAIEQFELYRKQTADKQPSTSELLEWIKVLEAEDFFSTDTDFANLDEKRKTILRYTLPVLAKSKDDLERVAAS